MNLTVTDTGDPNLTDTKSIAIAVSPVNDAPVLTVPNARTVAENTDLAIAEVSISDLDVGTGELEVTLTASNGVLSLARNTGLTFTDGDGIEDSTLKFTGSLVDLNNAIAEITYRGNLDFQGNDSIDITVSDLGNTGAGGALTDTKTIAVTVGQLNPSPNRP